VISGIEQKNFSPNGLKLTEIWQKCGYKPSEACRKNFLPHGHLGLALLLFIFDELSGPIGLFEQKP
jgi:hypothetical protein